MIKLFVSMIIGTLVLTAAAGPVHADKTLASFVGQDVSENTPSGILRIIGTKAYDGPTEITYKYCYLATTDGEPASISVYYENTIVDEFEFTKPVDSSCLDASKFEERTIETNEELGWEARFDYTNGDYRVVISNITIVAPLLEEDVKENSTSITENMTDNETISNRTNNTETAEESPAELDEAPEESEGGILQSIVNWFRGIFS